MNFIEILRLLSLLIPIILTVGIGIGGYFYKYLDITHKSMTYYMLVMLIVDAASWIVGAYGNNHIVLLLYSLIEMILFTVFYFKYFFNVSHKLIVILSFLAGSYILYEIMIFSSIELIQFQSYSKVIDDFIIIILTLTFFYEKINIYKESKWNNFKINAILLVYFSVNLFFFLPYNFLINESSGLKHYFWIGIVIITVLFYSYLTHSIWKNGRTRKLLPSGSR